MKRLLAAAFVCGLLSACVHPWVGRPVTQLEKEMGRPRSIQTRGDNRIYIYPDTLAGRGQITFTVDRRGIIRAWDATASVPGVFEGDAATDGTNGLQGPAITTAP